MFLTIEPAGAELIGKTVSPLMGKTADNNFTQTVGFVGSLSRTAEVNSLGVQRLAGQLSHVPPEVRSQFAAVAANVSKASLADTEEAALRPELATRPDDRVDR